MSAPGAAKIRVRRVDGAPVVALRVLLRGGARLEREPGLAYVTGRMLSEGTRRRDWARLAEELENRGMLLTTTGTFENHGLALDALASDWPLALEWAAELLYEPVFPAERCAFIRRQTAAELDSLSDKPDVRTAWRFAEQLYAPHPRGRRLQGDADSLARITPEQCAAFHAAAHADGPLVTIAGAIDEAEVGARAAELFGHRAPAADGANVRLDPASLPPAGGGGPERSEVRLPAGEQAHLFMGHLTLPRIHPDAAALTLLSVVLGAGAGLTGRIPLRVREAEGLAYSTFAQTQSGRGIDPGHLIAYAGTAPATLEQAEAAMRQEIARLVEGGISDDELDEARSYLLGREPFGYETARQWGDLMAAAALYDQPLDDPEWRRAQLEAPDRAAVEAAARRHLHPDRLLVTIGRPAA